MYSYGKILAIFPVMHDSSLSLSYTQQFVLPLPYSCINVLFLVSSGCFGLSFVIFFCLFGFAFLCFVLRVGDKGK